MIIVILLNLLSVIINLTMSVRADKPIESIAFAVLAMFSFIIILLTFEKCTKSQGGDR